MHAIMEGVFFLFCEQEGEFGVEEVGETDLVIEG